MHICTECNFVFFAVTFAGRMVEKGYGLIASYIYYAVSLLRAGQTQQNEFG